jgi:hypothetical protein
MALQYMRLTDYITQNFNNNMSTAAVFVDIEKAIDTTLHSGLLYKLSELEFSIGFSKLLTSFITNTEFKVSIERTFSTLGRYGHRGALVLYSLYINDVPMGPEAHLVLLVDDTCIYATE